MLCVKVWFQLIIKNKKVSINKKSINDFLFVLGFPLTVSLVASQLAEFKEDALSNNDRWDSYITHLKNRDLKSAIGYALTIIQIINTYNISHYP